MPDPNERDRTLARLALAALDWLPLERALMKISAQAREEGRRAGLQLAREACQEGVASDEVKAQGFVSWSAELCITAIEALEAQDT